MTSENAIGIFVLDPTAPPRELRQDMAVRPSDVRGKTLGFLWNSKPNGDILFGRLEERQYGNRRTNPGCCIRAI